MNLTRPTEVKALLNRLGIHPNRVLGQNFLIDANILRIMLATARVTPDDAVLEVGPGLGVLTGGLLREAGRVFAVEKDRGLYEHLKGMFADNPKLTLIHADILDTDLKELMTCGINKVVANLPYSISSRLLVELAKCAKPPQTITATVQREVAERITAQPGTGDYGILGIFLQVRYETEISKNISPSCFYPPPDISSSIVSLTLRDQPLAVASSRPQFEDLVKTCFSQRRKQIGKLLRAFGPDSAENALAAIGIDPHSRPEELPPEQWIELSNALPRIKKTTENH